jgi:hypothetical protein
MLECKYVCMYKCMYVCMYVYMYINMENYVCMYVCIFVWMSINMEKLRLFVCMFVCMYVFIYVCMYVCMYVPSNGTRGQCFQDIVRQVRLGPDRQPGDQLREGSVCMCGHY